MDARRSATRGGPAILVALAATAAYGALQGIVIAKLGLPSFVVTLAGQLGLSGLLLYLINATGSIGVGGVINLHNTVINDIEAGDAQPGRHLDRDDRARRACGRDDVLQRLPPPGQPAWSPRRCRSRC